MVRTAPSALGGQTANVIATLKGTVNPELVYVVSSHYDSVAIGPGADDDTSGTAALLEAARILAGHPHAGDDRLRVVHRARKPACSAAASSCGARSPTSCKIVGALNNDMIGWANDHRLDNTIRYSNPGIRDIQHGAAMQFTQPDHLRRALLQEHRRRRLLRGLRRHRRRHRLVPGARATRTITSRTTCSRRSTTS